MLAWLNSLFDITIKLDGSLNKLTTETIEVQYRLSKQKRIATGGNQNKGGLNNGI